MIRNIFVLIVICVIIAKSSGMMVSRVKRNVETCGAPTLKTSVHGKSITHGSFPWIVAFMHTGTRPIKFFCGGTLISKTFVVSATHCILDERGKKKLLPRDVLAFFGAHNLNKPFEFERISVSPTKIYIHADWNYTETNYVADISLLEFEANRIHFDDFIQPICLWNSMQEPVVTEGTVIAWSKSKLLSKGHEKLPKMFEVTMQSHLNYSSKRTFCVGLKSGSGASQGDSGGGLFVEIDGIFYLKGVHSSPSPTTLSECDNSENAIYTNVLQFRDWIRDTIGKAFAPVTNIFCIFEMKHVWCCKQLKTCVLNQTIDNENHLLRSQFNKSVEQFYIKNNTKVEFLPRSIGEKFPNLKKFVVPDCGLTVLRDFYFKDMWNLQSLWLNNNKIKTIESNAFKDLECVTGLSLHNNLIEALDERLFKTMVSLEEVDLSYNKIKFLSPSTFEIPEGRLRRIDLESMYASVKDVESVISGNQSLSSL